MAMLEKSVIIALLVIAVWATFLDGMIFGKIGNYVVDKFPKWLSKPLVDCVICQTMWWGSTAYWLIWGESGKEWLIVVIAAMGFNTIFAKMKIR